MEDINQAILNSLFYFTILARDFNAKFGKKRNEAKTFLGRHGIGGRNKRGNLLLRVFVHHQLAAMNTFFKKTELCKLTWIILDGKNKNEFDIIITNNHCITVLNILSVVCDYRMVRAIVSLNL